MLTKEIMGVLALWILWLNAGLVVASAFKQLANVRSLRRRMERARAKGELVAGAAQSDDGGVFAARTVDQIGRAMTVRGPERVLFTSGAQRSDVRAGTVRTEAGAFSIEAGTECEVWVDAAREREAVACPSEAAFDAAFREGSRFKGVERKVALEVRSGDRVWVWGARQGGQLGARDDGPLLVSTIDPFAYLRACSMRLVLFVVGSIAALAAVTAIALWPPAFGWVSTLGGALGLAYFLAIQPLGVAVRDSVRTPARKSVGALWQRPTANARAWSAAS